MTDAFKKAAALAAVQYVEPNIILGVGTGSTVNYFIDALATIKNKIEGAVASSNATAEKLKKIGIPLLDLNSTGTIPLYVDGTDAVNKHLQLIKGGGAAHTREKIIACCAKKFICIADESKWVDLIGKNTALPIEVIPMARSYVAREIVKLGGTPEYRQGVVTDNGNVILDVHFLDFSQPLKLEHTLNNITGVVAHGLFAERAADLLLLGTKDGVITKTAD